jgi:hypothetical protein
MAWASLWRLEPHSYYACGGSSLIIISEEARPTFTIHMEARVLLSIIILLNDDWVLRLKPLNNVEKKKYRHFDSKKNRDIYSWNLEIYDKVYDESRDFMKYMTSLIFICNSALWRCYLNFLRFAPRKPETFFLWFRI